MTSVCEVCGSGLVVERKCASCGTPALTYGVTRDASDRGTLCLVRFLADEVTDGSGVLSEPPRRGVSASAWAKALLGACAIAAAATALVWALFL